jgi:catechol 2,3-dioxygenase-like lactoylglutathione lyase family enzyme
MAQVRYMVDDVDAAVVFYTNALGFGLKQQFGPAMAIVHHDGLDLWLAGPSASASRAMPDGARPVSGGWNRFVLTVDNLDDLVARLRGEGVRFRNEIVTGPGGRQILCEDPAGNPIELFQPS